MADFLQEIESIIEAGTTEAAGDSTTWPIYRSHLPDSTGIGDRAVALIHTEGGPDIGGTGTDRAEVEEPGVQVVTRGLPQNQFSTTYEESDLTDITGLDSDPDSTDDGFYFTVVDSEKFLGNPIIFDGFIIVPSFVPDLSGADICSQVGQAFLYVFDITSGEGFFADAVTVGDAARRTDLGDGAPSDPRISISPEGDQMYIQTSAGRIIQLPPPPRNQPPASIIYWKQNF